MKKENENIKSANNENYKWKFEDIYANLDEDCRKELEEAKEIGKEITSLKGNLNNYEDILECLKLETILAKISEKAGAYTYLKYSQNMKDIETEKLSVTVGNTFSNIEKELSFVTSEILENDDEFLEKMLDDERFSKYKISLERLFKEKKHILSKKEEKILTAIGSKISYSGIYDIFTNLEMNYGEIEDSKGEKHTLTDAMYSKYLASEDRILRKNAYERLYEKYMLHNQSITEMYISHLEVIKEELKLRNYNSLLESSSLSNGVSEDVYDILLSAVNEMMEVNHRALAIKRKMCNFEKNDYHFYDIYYNPLEDNLDISFEEGKKMVLDALSVLGDDYIKVLEKAFSNNWVDVYPKEGKENGAYSLGIYDVHPYVMLNHTGSLDDVSTIAHEMGHAMHSYLSSKTQDFETPDYTIMVAEVASTVNEMLFAEYNISKEDDKKKKAKLLFDLIDRIRATLFRQTMFAEFEKYANEAIWDEKEITRDDLNAYYSDLIKKYFKDEVVESNEIMYEWSRIPHFYRPYYVYKYATGISSAIYIAKHILENGKNNEREYIEKYLDMLKSGGSKLSQDTLKIAGVDLEDKNVYKEAINYMNDKITELEGLIEE